MIPLGMRSPYSWALAHDVNEETAALSAKPEQMSTLKD